MEKYEELTLDYYNKNTDAFIQSTKNAMMMKMHSTFAKMLPEGGKILDLGCGSGRDSRAFIKRGFDVTAIDGSEEVCKRATKYIGKPVRCMLFSELDYEKEFDGVWACAALLHVPKDKMRDIVKRIKRSMKGGGAIFVSVMYGDFEGDRRSKYYSDYEEEELRNIFVEEGFRDLETFVTEDLRAGREGDKWLNLLGRCDG